MAIKKPTRSTTRASSRHRSDDDGYDDDEKPTRASRSAQSSKKSSAGSTVNAKVITGKARSSYMRVTKLQEDDNGNMICSSGILIPKKDKATVTAIREAIRSVAEKKFGSEIDIFKSKKMRQPLLDGDELADDPESSIGDEARGCYFLNAKAYKLPGVVDKHNERIIDIDELDEICVSGYYFRFSLTFKAYDNESKGVRALLNNLMFMGEGERLDGGKSAEQEFEDYAEDGYDDE